MATLTVVIYAEQCVQAGEEARGVEREEAERYDDYVLYEGTAEEIVAEAQACLNSARLSGAGRDVYLHRVARTLCDAVDARVIEFGPRHRAVDEAEALRMVESIGHEEIERILDDPTYETDGGSNLDLLERILAENGEAAVAYILS